MPSDINAGGTGSLYGYVEHGQGEKGFDERYYGYPAATTTQAPAPKPVAKPSSSSSSKPSAPKPATTPAPAAPVPQAAYRAQITKPPGSQTEGALAGLESTIVAPIEATAPTQNVSYLTGNTQAQTTSRFLKKKKSDDKVSLFA